MRKQKAKVVIEWNGKRYRVGGSAACDGRACSLHDPSRCDDCDSGRGFPCDEINDALFDITGAVSKRCFKEI